jgi:cytochrome c-type biogenesis protein CcmF
LIPELGHFALVLGFCLAVALGTVPLLGAHYGRTSWMRSAFSLSAGMFVFTAVAFAALTFAFVTDDFSVTYVANNSNSQLPLHFKFSAVWGAHEGSFLLWLLIMSVWTLAVARFARTLPLTMVSRVLGVMGVLSTGFFAFALFTSNPFLRSLPLAPPDGADLNPLLQDFGLIVHPPILYTGYVGFSVAFAFAIATLLSGRLDTAWARWSRPWTNVAWAFLTVGIALGSWWAYYELGWGGWWFWDPVENASFMPWLAGTALVHSLAVTEKRGVFKSWTVLLAILAFSLSLLGAFIVRSGVLTSVHAFAVDPDRGLFILAFLVLVVGGSLTLYAFRANVIRSRVRFSGLSRELLLLVNNLLLVLALAVVLLGTVYPLAHEAATGGAKVSIGPPYFNALFLPIMAVLAIVLALGPAARWKQTEARALLKSMWPIAVGALALGIGVPLMWSGAVAWEIAVAVALAAWIVLTHLRDCWSRSKGRMAGAARLPASYWGMFAAHVGFAVSLLGICLTSQYTVEKDVRVMGGDSATVGAVTLKLVRVVQGHGPNYTADRGIVEVSEGGDTYRLYPEKRRYFSGGNVMTEAAIRPGFTRDVYIALGEPLLGGAWAVRVHYKPFVRWVWLGGLLMAFGGVLAVCDSRYRKLRVRDIAAAQASGATRATTG